MTRDGSRSRPLACRPNESRYTARSPSPLIAHVKARARVSRGNWKTRLSALRMSAP